MWNEPARLQKLKHKSCADLNKNMSYCREEGKDQLIFVTEEDHSIPSSVVLPEDDDEYAGLINASGDINWDCPCLQGMADGPCGEEFKSAFSCFHYSEAETKGSDCVSQFRDMQICFSKYPEIYGKDNEESKEKDKTEKENGDVIDSVDKELNSNSQEIEVSKVTENGSTATGQEGSLQEEAKS